MHSFISGLALFPNIVQLCDRGDEEACDLSAQQGGSGSPLSCCRLEGVFQAEISQATHCLLHFLPQE